MAYDDVFPLLGDFGRYQKRVFVLLCLPTIMCALQLFSVSFIQAHTDFRCQLDHELSNASYELPQEVLESSYPLDGDGNKYSSCYMYRGNETVSCSSYIYDKSTYKSTTFMEWNLVCDRSHLQVLTSTFYMIGNMMGSFTFGNLSDRFGRKPILMLLMILQFCFGVATAISPDYWVYIGLRWIVGASTSGIFLIAYVISMEMVGPRYRFLAGVVYQLFYTGGYILTTLFAYFIRDWRTLYIALTVPEVLFLSYWWLIPESARWLVTRNRIPEAVQLIQTAAKENKVIVSSDDIKQMFISEAKLQETEENATILDVFKHKDLRIKSIIIFFGWLVNGMAYYGLSLITSDLGGNDFINFLVSGLVEIPGNSLLLVTLNRYGRKPTLCISMIITGVALLVSMAIPDEQQWLVTSLAMVGKLAITSSYAAIYVFSSEQFPTVVRSAAMGTASSCSETGGVLAPLINSTNQVWKLLPLVIFGALSLISGCLSLYLPETLNKALPDTIASLKESKEKKTEQEQEQVRY